MAQSSRRRAYQGTKQDKAKTLYLLGQANNTQPMQETKTTSRNRIRQEKATSEYLSPQTPNTQKVSCSRSRSECPSRTYPRWDRPCKSAAYDQYEREIAALHREYVRLDWMRRLRRMPHRQQQRVEERSLTA